MVATFEYKAARSVREAVDLLAQSGGEAKVLAGGQSLLPLINLGLAQPGALIDINRVPGLDGIEQRDGTLVCGTLVRHAVAEQSPIVARACPLLAEVLPLIGDRQVRNRGTLGGSIAHADPVAEIPTVATCLGATMHVEGPNGARDLDPAAFFVTYLTTSLEPSELLTEVRFPAAQPGAGFAFEELVRRKGDFAIVAAAAAVQLGADGTCSSVRLALAGAAATPIRATRAESTLTGQRPTPDAIRAAAQATCDGIEPESDVIASADYRAAMTAVYARRALTLAVERATAG